MCCITAELVCGIDIFKPGTPFDPMIVLLENLAQTDNMPNSVSDWVPDSLTN